MWGPYKINEENSNLGIFSVAILAMMSVFLISVELDGMGNVVRYEDAELDMRCLEKWDDVMNSPQASHLRQGKMMAGDPIHDFITDGCLDSYGEWMEYTHPDWGFIKKLQERRINT